MPPARRGHLNVEVGELEEFHLALGYGLRRVDWDGIRDDGLGAARSTRYTRLVIEPGVSKTSSPSGSRTVARVISPRGVD